MHPIIAKNSAYTSFWILLSYRKICPCADERSDMAPSFYVGNSEKHISPPPLKYDWRRMQFAPIKLPGRSVPQEKQNKYNVSFNRDVSLPKCNATLASYIDEGMLHDAWRLIRNVQSQYPGADASGGVFLYPRQAMLLTYLVQNALTSIDQSLVNEPFRICETGFGAGHSAALFLSSAPNVEVVSFDKYDRPYQTPIFNALQSHMLRAIVASV